MNAQLIAERADTLINPSWLNPESYLALLNAAFPGCWDQRAYYWYLGRTFNGRSGDLLVRACGSRVLSGMALLPRQILVGDCAIDVCVISAAATLPSERGCGHYSTLLRAAAERARERQYTALLGFVTRDNLSARPLLEMGARGIPSFYISSVSGSQICPPSYAAGPRLQHVSDDHRQSGLDGAGVSANQRGIPTGNCALTSSAQFHYANDEDWRSQFTRRPHPVRLLRFEQNLIGLIETVQETDRLQWLSCPAEGTLECIGKFAALSAASRRGFFMYTLDPGLAAGARRLGLKVRYGYLLVLPSGYCCERWRALASASWHVQSGDRL